MKAGVDHGSTDLLPLGRPKQRRHAKNDKREAHRGPFEARQVIFIVRLCEAVWRPLWPSAVFQGVENLPRRRGDALAGGGDRPRRLVASTAPDGEVAEAVRPGVQVELVADDVGHALRLELRQPPVIEVLVPDDVGRLVRQCLHLVRGRQAVADADAPELRRERDQKQAAASFLTLRDPEELAARRDQGRPANSAAGHGGQVGLQRRHGACPGPGPRRVTAYELQQTAPDT